MSYGSQIWGQAQNANIKKISILQNKAIRLINFASIDEHAEILYKMCNILRLSDIVNLQIFLYMYDHHHNNLPKALSNTLKSIKGVHSPYLTRGSKSHELIFPRARTTVYHLIVSLTNRLKHGTI